MNNLPLVSRDEIDAAYRLASRLAYRLGNEFAQGAPIHLSAESANTLKTWWGALPGLSASAHQFLDEQGDRLPASLRSSIAQQAQMADLISASRLPTELGTWHGGADAVLSPAAAGNAVHVLRAGAMLTLINPEWRAAHAALIAEAAFRQIASLSNPLAGHVGLAEIACLAGLPVPASVDLDRSPMVWETQERVFVIEIDTHHDRARFTGETADYQLASLFKQVRENVAAIISGATSPCRLLTPDGDAIGFASIEAPEAPAVVPDGRIRIEIPLMPGPVTPQRLVAVINIIESAFECLEDAARYDEGLTLRVNDTEAYAGPTRILVRASELFQSHDADDSPSP